MINNNSFRITLIRHGKTRYSETQQFMGGTLDLPCTKDALVEARELGKVLKGNDYFRIYASPLKRTLQTAKKIFPCESINLDKDLIERGLGNWAGYKKEELNEMFPEAFLPSGHIDPFYNPVDGEPIENVISRVKRFITKLTDLYTLVYNDKNEDQSLNIAIVTHNGVIRVARCLLEHKPFKEIFMQSEPYLVPIQYIYDGKSWFLKDGSN